MYFDGDAEVSLCCILRYRWKNLIIVLVSQNNMKTLGPMPALYTSSFDRKCKFALVSRRSAGPNLKKSFKSA